MSQQREILTMILNGQPVSEVAARFRLTNEKAKSAALVAARQIMSKGFWKSRPSCFEEEMIMRKMIERRLSE